MNMDLDTLLAEINALIPMANVAVGIINPAAAATLVGAEKVVAEIETGIPLIEGYLANLKAAKAGFTPEEWTAFVAAKQKDDDAIAAL